MADDMDAVNFFNAELQSLYDVKPPISKGKMTSVTRAALKGVKLYKHIVQSVEKFIQKCKSEYKIPGLYVIDSIIRQSRHQFGAEKDVFAPRFSRNIVVTFAHLYKCPDEEKPKIIRVLNLWQKNKIFSPDTIHPLFELADPTNPLWKQLVENQERASGSGVGFRAGPNNAQMGTPAAAAISSLLSNLPAIPFKKEVLDYDYGDDDDGGNDSKNLSGDHSQQQNSGTNVGLDALGSILANPEILRQLANLQEQIAAATSQGPAGYSTPEQERQRKLAELNKQEAAFDQRLAQTVARLPFAVDYEPAVDDGRSRKDIDQNSNQLGNNQNQLLPPPFFQQINEQQHHQQHGNQDNNMHHQQQQQQQQAQAQQTLLNILGQRHDGQNPFGLSMPFPGQGGVPFPPQELSQAMVMFNNQLPGDGNQSFNAYNSSQSGVVEIDLTDDSREKDRRDRRRKRSRERRSRSRSRTKRSRSRSRGKEGRDRKRYRSRSRDRKEEKDREREKEKERMRKGLPPIKKEHLSVCTTTLWVGHLSKLVSQEDLSDTFGAYGDIVSIDLIPPRGCAFIVMNRRQDSLRALDRLKNTKLQGKSITVAWAPGKGMKGREWKDYWEIDAGVSYIPWSKLHPDVRLEEFEDGGCVDEDTLPDFLKHKLKSADKEKGDSQPPESENSQDVVTANIAVPTGGGGTPVMSLMSMGGMQDTVPKQGDADARSNLAAAMAGQIGAGGMPGMSNAFGMPPVGMMPMGMPVGMVPPPMMGGGMPNFAGMGVGGIPGMPGMMQGMMPPLGMGGPGLLGDIPSPSMANMSQLNNMASQLMDQNIRDKDDDNKKSDRKEGKRRSRFNDPDEIVQPVDDLSRASPTSQDGSKDDRPVFERLKSLAEGYGFGGGFNNDKAGPSLLGNPGTLLGGPRGPGPRGFPQSPLLPQGGNQFAQPPPGFMGERPRGPSPMGGGGPRPWFDASNPFLNPNPNPFAGNPFIQSNLTENPFEIGAPAPASDLPQPLFGNRPERSRFGGWGGPDESREANRDSSFSGGRNSVWQEDAVQQEDTPMVGGRGRGGWRDEPETHRGGRGGFRGRGRGGSRDPWEGRDRGNDREDRRGRRDDRDRSRSRDRDRTRSRDRFRDTGRRSRDDDRDRNPRSREKSQDKTVPTIEEENWEDECSGQPQTQQANINIVAPPDDDWEAPAPKTGNDQWNTGGWHKVDPPVVNVNENWEPNSPVVKNEDWETEDPIKTGTTETQNPAECDNIQEQEPEQSQNASNDMETSESYQEREENTCSQQNEEFNESQESPQWHNNILSIPQDNEEANLNFPDQSQNSIEDCAAAEIERTEEGNRNFSNFTSSFVVHEREEINSSFQREEQHHSQPEESSSMNYQTQEKETVQEETLENTPPTNNYETSSNGPRPYCDDESQSQSQEQFITARQGEEEEFESYHSKNGDCSGNGDNTDSNYGNDFEENHASSVCVDDQSASSEQSFTKHTPANLSEAPSSCTDSQDPGENEDVQNFVENHHENEVGVVDTAENGSS